MVRRMWILIFLLAAVVPSACARDMVARHSVTVQSDQGGADGW